MKKLILLTIALIFVLPIVTACYIDDYVLQQRAEIVDAFANKTEPVYCTSISSILKSVMINEESQYNQHKQLCSINQEEAEFLKKNILKREQITMQTDEEFEAMKKEFSKQKRRTVVKSLNFFKSKWGEGYCSSVRYGIIQDRVGNFTITSHGLRNLYGHSRCGIELMDLC